MVSIKEIAKYTGASPTTVSNVIHGRTNKVSKEKFKQIQAALEKFNYSEQMAGRILANNGSRIIGFIIQDNVGLESREFSNPYIGELTQAIEYYVRQRGYYLIYHRSKSFDESLRVMQSWQMEGVVLSGVQPNELVAWHQYLNTPAVFLDAFEDQASDMRGKIKNVGLDDRAEAKKMTEFLIDAGHSDIAFLSRGTVNSWQGVDAIRRDGVIAALKQHHLPIETAIIGLPVFMTEFDEWLVQFIKQKFNGKSALFFSSDLLASYALSRIQSAGVRIPDDISVVGFDGNILSQVSFPKLTTIFQDLNLKADQAINLLFKQINQEEILENNILIEGKLLERDSVKYN
ncbi:LacI family DNA-binding transcriptional regulator [Pseudolactococcus plantarum]|nr:LacI family DNA-binding transcriptional regulator [Lactococcus plantarum]HCN75463.1 LacI family transcriptional regulator [Lactococcus sp.]